MKKRLLPLQVFNMNSRQPLVWEYYTSLFIVIVMNQYIYCFTCLHLSFISVSLLFHSCSMRLAPYIRSPFILSEAAHLISSSCSTMMTPSLFLPFYTINTWDVVASKPTYSWESTSYFSFALKLYQLAITVLKLRLELNCWLWKLV